MSPPDQRAIEEAVSTTIAALPSAESRRSYEHVWRGFNEWLLAEKLHVLEVKPRDFETYIASMRDQRYARGTVLRAVSVMQQAYDALFRADLIAGNPARAADVSGLLPEESNDEETPPLSDDEKEKLFGLPASDWRDRRDRIVLLLLFEHGWRRADLATINVDGFRDGALTGITKGGKTRTVQVGPPLQREIEDWCAFAKLDSGPLLPRREGGKDPINGAMVYLILKRALGRAGMDINRISPDDIRLATKALNGELDQRRDAEGGFVVAERAPAEPARPQPFTIADALTEVFISRDAFVEMIDLLRHKKNLVLAGPPGVGKTLVSSSLAFALMGERDEARLERVQFHQSYNYEDFVRGYRPKESGGGFEFRDGPFLSICQRARRDGLRPYVLVIDEINRGNLSKILGDLMLLIEGDKRSVKWSTRLTYSKADEPAFFVPPNLHVIGTMNTADRSLAMVDYALRRRFAFVDVKPAFEEPAFRQHLAALGVPRKLQNKIILGMGELNKSIAEDRRNLGEGYCIGHSYFCQRPSDGKCDEVWFQRIIKFEVGQLLKEYWFDDESKVSAALSQLLASGN